MPKKKRKRKALNTVLYSRLRQVWQASLEYQEAFNLSRFEPGKYQCNVCKGIFKRKELQLDHLEPVGPTPWSRNAKPDASWDDYFARLFPGIEGYQVLCKECHKVKTHS